MLQDGSAEVEALRDRARELGGVMSAEAAVAGEQLTQELGELKLAAQGLFNEFSANTVPALGWVIDKLTTMVGIVRENADAIQTGLIATLGAVFPGLTAVTSAVGAYNSTLGQTKNGQEQTNAALQNTIQRQQDLAAVTSATGRAFSQGLQRRKAERKQEAIDEQKFQAEIAEAGEGWAADELQRQEKARQQKLAAVNKEVDSILAARQSQRDRELDFELGLAQVKDQIIQQQVANEKAAMEQLASQIEGIANQVLSVVKSSFSGVIDGTKDVGSAFLDMFGGIGKMIAEMLTQFLVSEAAKRAAAMITAQTQIAANSSVAAISAIAAHAGIPFAGLAIGMAAAGAIVAAIASFWPPKIGGTGSTSTSVDFSRLDENGMPTITRSGSERKFAEGGLVTGGTPGRDSVPALLTPGEIVIPTRLASAMRRLFGGGGLHGRPQGCRGLPRVHQRRA